MSAIPLIEISAECPGKSRPNRPLFWLADSRTRRGSLATHDRHSPATSEVGGDSTFHRISDSPVVLFLRLCLAVAVEHLARRRGSSVPRL